MENENLKPVKELTPFTKMIMTIGTLPSSFYSSMTYYEAMCWLYEYLKNEVIPTVNNNGEAVEELQEKFIELETWVHEYEETQLPIEVKNKLDEMADDGTLTSLIEEYMNLNAQLVYNSIEEMKNATNITEGSFVKTYGFYEFNDGGGALYKIRKLNNESPNEIDLFALNDETLVAELIIKNEINIKQLGAKGDNIKDNSTIIQYALNNFDYIKIPTGNYKITQTLSIPSYKKIEGSSGYYGKAIIRNSNCDALNISHDSYFSIIKDLCIIGDSTKAGIIFTNDTGTTITRVVIENLSINNQLYGMTDSYIDGELINDDNKPTLWNCIFNNISMFYNSNSTNYGIYLKQPTTAFGISFNNYVSGDTSTHLENIRATFNSSNFGFVNGTKFENTSNSTLIFNECNFECDETITSGNVISISTQIMEFNHCKFISRLNASAGEYFKFHANNRGIIFTNCDMSVVPDTTTNWFPSVGSNAQHYGALLFLGHNRVKPNFSGGAYEDTYISNLGLSIPVVRSSSDLTYIPKNAIFVANGKLCRWDGTQIVDYDNNPITL